MAGNCITSILLRDVAFASGCCFFGFGFRFFKFLNVFSLRFYQGLF